MSITQTAPQLVSCINVAVKFRYIATYVAQYTPRGDKVPCKLGR